MTIHLLGDSVLKGVTLREDRYVLYREAERRFSERTGTRVDNLCRMGCTTDKAIKSQLDRLHPAENGEDLVLIEYGGNDCDYNWQEISDDPEAGHLCHVPPERFGENYRSIIRGVREKGAIPAVVSLLPIEPERYFRWFCRDGVVPERVLRWLSEVNVIYRWQELYSHMADSIAREEGVPVLDLRSVFLGIHNFGDYLCADGIHPTVQGHEMIWDSIEKKLCALADS